MISDQTTGVQPATTPSNQPALLEIDATRGAHFSEHYSAEEYRSHPAYPARWSKRAPKTAHCDECAMRQHETDGASGPRMRPRHTRILGKVTMYLCSRHAFSWYERDADDQGRGRGSQR